MDESRADAVCSFSFSEKSASKCLACLTGGLDLSASSGKGKRTYLNDQDQDQDPEHGSGLKFWRMGRGEGVAWSFLF
jgi:hypothetical protein